MAPFMIPTVDLSNYLHDSPSTEAAKVVTDIRNACLTSGFFQIVGHGIPKSIQKAVIDSAKLVFDLPLEEKLTLTSANGRGYETIGSQTLEQGMKTDLKEGYYVGPEVPDGQPLYKPFRHPNKWPLATSIPPSEFKEPLLDYRRQLCELASTLMLILGRGLPYETKHVFHEFCTSPLAVVRLLHYPAQPDLTDDKQLGAGAHTDFGAITLLLQDDKGGLQVLQNETNAWVDVPPNSDAYVVNVGDMLQMWTKGEYRSNIHRVINKSGQHRYSVPFFFDGNLDMVVKPLDGSEDNGPSVEEFMLERFKTTYK